VIATSTHEVTPGSATGDKISTKSDTLNRDVQPKVSPTHGVGCGKLLSTELCEIQPKSQPTDEVEYGKLLCTELWIAIFEFLVPNLLIIPEKSTLLTLFACSPRMSKKTCV
jgi:hypothetical protein